MFEDSTLIIAFALTLFAGLSTGIGGAMAFFAKHTNTKFLSVALGFSAGVMIYVSFVDVLPIAQESLSEMLGERLGMTIAVLSFFAGIILIGVIDKLIPHYENPHEVHRIEEMQDKKEAKKQRKLLHVGIFTAIALALHNFPEGLATFVAAMEDLKMGIFIALAIAIHNIPEGIAVSIPIYYATQNRKKAFTYSFVSGLAEPVGAVVGYFLLMALLNGYAFGILFAGVAGIMVFISLDQLLPAAREYGEHHLSIYGLVAGMLTMAVSLILFL